MATKTKNRFKQGEGKLIPKAYLRLVAEFRLRPIESEQELAEATAMAEDLSGRAELLPEEEQYLEVLIGLIEAYEDTHCTIPDVSAQEMLRFLIDQRGVTQRVVSDETGVANSTITALLKGKRAGGREMTLAHIGTFAKYFGVEPSVFLPGNGVEEQRPHPSTGPAASRRRSDELIDSKQFMKKTPLTKPK